MKVITIEDRAYKSIISKLDALDQHFRTTMETIEVKYAMNEKQQIDHTQYINERKAEEIYLDGKEVCDLLRISTRTLLRLRKDGQVNYLKLRGKCIYRLSNIKSSLDRKVIVSDPLTLENFIKKYNQLVGRKE